MLTTFLTVLLAVLAGTAIACVLGVLPGLHIYNVMGVLVLGVMGLAETGVDVPAEVFLPAMTGMIVGWSVVNTIPAVLLGTPDESALFTVLPGQKYLMSGRGFEGGIGNDDSGDFGDPGFDGFGSNGYGDDFGNGFRRF